MENYGQRETRLLIHKKFKFISIFMKGSIITFNAEEKFVGKLDIKNEFNNIFHASNIM